MKVLDLSYDPLKERKISHWLETTIGTEKFRPGLLRLEKMLQESKQQLESRGIRVVIIGGTNGKGETSHSLAALLRSSDIPYALWTSPHVLSIRERIQFNSGPISYEALWESLQRCFKQLQEKNIEAPTFYEFLLMVFTDLALRSSPSIQVCLLEVGLGGRLDGVNIFTPHLTCITSLSRDHENILGVGFKNILREKLGITRPGVPLVTNLELAYCREQVESFSQDKAFPWLDLFARGLCKKDQNYSQRNQILATTLFHFLQDENKMVKGHWENELILSAWKNFHFPATKGRNETMTLGERSFIFIGAHNIDGMRKICQLPQLQQVNGAKGIELILTSFSKRSLEEMRNLLKILLSSIGAGKELVVTPFDHERAADGSELLKLKQFPELAQVNFINDWQAYITCEKIQAKKILVTGSYYFVGVVEAFLLQSSQP